MGSELYIRSILALILILSIMGIISFLVRKFLLGQTAIGKKIGERRLSIEEVMPLDIKRKLVLIKRDDVEHLILLAPNSELLIESNIKKIKSGK